MVYECYKARLVARGFEEVTDNLQKDSPTCYHAHAHDHAHARNHNAASYKCPIIQAYMGNLKANTEDWQAKKYYS